ncbi:hypothetical protein BDP27DRAFT_1309935 [Rhodocollybia butyracea]|uniref:Small nuclear ribonucleoprotein Prp3 C-terminal domain-containing protein n=1 Tax=Rhodocollybia butyracea TaxID=206335 RepID=A0A9P5QBY3_9AGAR|nr:hypothetical protein BDP27DRAFT_1309935 [Rhodocollybia butyracea]
METLFEELQLINCSLLPGELFILLDHCTGWKDALQSYAEDGYHESVTKLGLPQPVFQVGLEDFNVWFEISLPSSSWDSASSGASLHNLIAVKGENISRYQQERWQKIVQERFQEIGDSEYPIYQLLSLHLLPMLHEEFNLTQETKAMKAHSAAEEKALASTVSSAQIVYHALFTSHHLVSPTKRRNLQQWSSSLSIRGFSKVGYPGVIYAEGEHEDVQEFVDNVKAMQWLALRLRFMEPIPNSEKLPLSVGVNIGWKEFQKVGEVIEEMKRIGREKYVVEMGLGSSKN